MHRLLRGAAFALACAAPAVAAATPHQPVLVDQRGSRVDVFGPQRTPVVLTFVAAHCKDTCPLVNAEFHSIQDQIAHAHTPLRLVTITLDPEHDSLSDMRKLANTFRADPRYWRVAGGARSDVHAVMRRFNVFTSRGRDGYAEMHTTYVYLIDRHGKVAKTILASTQLPEDLFAELQRTWRRLTS